MSAARNTASERCLNANWVPREGIFCYSLQPEDGNCEYRRQLRSTNRLWLRGWSFHFWDVVFRFPKRPSRLAWVAALLSAWA